MFQRKIKYDYSFLNSKTVVGLVHLDFLEKLSYGSKYPTHSLRIDGDIYGALRHVREFSIKITKYVAKTV